MTFDLTSNGTVWSLDARWSYSARRFTSYALRAQAKALGASHFAITGRNPSQAALFAFGASVERKAVQPLALAVAADIGPSAIVEMQIEPGRFWFVGTTPAGTLAPYADTVVRGDDREAFIERLPSDTGDIQHISLDDVDGYIAGLTPVTLTLQATSTARQRRRFAALALAVMATSGIVWFWHRHELELAREKAVKIAQAAARRRQMAALIPTTAPPDAWLSACLSHIDKVALFRGGWILKAWTCRNSGLLLTWERAGGTMADAPAGTIKNDPDTIEETLPLTFSMKRSAPPAKEDGARALIAILQTLGVRPTISHSVVRPGLSHGRNAIHGGAMTIVHFDWPTDPRYQQWDTISGLTFTELKHETGAADGGASITPTYKFTASIDPARPQ